MASQSVAGAPVLDYRTSFVAGVLPQRDRNCGFVSSTDAAGAYDAARTAMETDAFLTGPSRLDAQATRQFRAVMDAPRPVRVDEPLPLDLG